MPAYIAEFSKGIKRLIDQFVEQGNNDDLNNFAKEKAFELAILFRCSAEEVKQEFYKHRWVDPNQQSLL